RRRTGLRGRYQRRYYQNLTTSPNCGVTSRYFWRIPWQADDDVPRVDFDGGLLDHGHRPERFATPSRTGGSPASGSPARPPRGVGKPSPFGASSRAGEPAAVAGLLEQHAGVVAAGRPHQYSRRNAPESTADRER